MKKGILLIAALLLPLGINAEDNASTTQKEQNLTTHKSVSKEHNRTKTAKEIMEEKIKEQMEREKKYAKEQKFYQGDAYDLKAHEVDPNSLPDVPVIEPDDDFDITDVYRDDI
jgi:Ni/Co efflux regulator RcnB